MREEVQNAANFIVKVMKMGHGNVAQQIGDAQLENLTNAIVDSLIEKYTGHWFPQKPTRGSGFRSIRIGTRMDQTIVRAVEKVGLSPDQVHKAFSLELTMWVDPREVSYKLGDNGSISVLYQKKQVNGDANSTVTNTQLRKPDSNNASTTKAGYLPLTPSTDADSESSASNSTEMEDMDIGNQVGADTPSTSGALKPTQEEAQKMETRSSPSIRLNNSKEGTKR